MKYRYAEATFFSIILFLILYKPAKAEPGLFPISWSGTAAIRAGEFDRALAEILADTSKQDTVFRFFKQGIAYAGAANQSKAIFLFRYVAPKSPELAPFAYEYIGDIERELKRPHNALHAYRASLNYDIPRGYQLQVFEKIRSVIETDSTEIARAPWLDEYYTWYTTRKRAEISPHDVLFDSLVAENNWQAFDSLLGSTGPIFAGTEGCSRLKALLATAIPDSVLSTKGIFALARLAASCGQTAASESRLKIAQERKKFGATIPDRQFLYFRAKLHYDLGQFEPAIRMYKKFLRKYGNDSEAIMLLARALRKLDKEMEAGEWYDKHVKLFPSHPKTQEIIWLRAWQEEEQKKHDRAAALYRKIYTANPRGQRSEEAHLRHAISYFRRDKYDSALVILDRQTKKFPDGNLVSGGAYWRAKCYLALDKYKESIDQLHMISRRDPSDYYAHRARQTMILLGDTTAQLLVDTLADYAAAHAWLDSISPRSRKPLTPYDSISYRRGVYLCAIGAADRAGHFLDKLEISFPGNLSLQFELAALYKIADAPALSYRVARRLAWRIPQENRSQLPLPVYAVLYPRFFSELIRNEAVIFNVDPMLVSAVIRQESIFNQKIVSPAGAVGLMQIMPYTGDHIAGKLGHRFAVDSLYFPALNIRFGTYYIRELLTQFSDNIVLVLAGYNGGPHNAKKWYERNKDEEFDLFVEDIAFSETRGYVKKVLANYWTYRTLAQIPEFAFQ